MLLVSENACGKGVIHIEKEKSPNTIVAKLILIAVHTYPKVWARIHLS